MKTLVRNSRALLHGSLFALVAAGALLTTPTAAAKAPGCVIGHSIAVREMPQQGREVLALIQAGGPFPNSRDGVNFGNRERLLPTAQRGFYREYTVRTPGARNRGARRIVCGGDQRLADQCFYSDDHYKSFKCIAR